MRTGRDDEKISLPFNIDKPRMKRAVFLDFSAHLLITAFANSHLKVLRQCNAVIISAVRIYGNLLCQFIRMLFLFSVYSQY